MNAQRSVTTVLVGEVAVPVNTVTMDGAVANIIAGCSEPWSYVVTPNLHHMLMVDQGLIESSIYVKARLSLADGWPVARMASLRAGVPVERVAGSDLLEAILRTCGEGRPLVMVGGSSRESVKPLLDRARRFGWVPHHEPAPPADMDDPHKRSEILESATRFGRGGIVVLGLGAPKQERAAQELVKFAGNGVILCLGMSINFSSGEVKRAGKNVQRLRAEWVHRLLSEPRRLAPRYLRDARFYLRFRRMNMRPTR